MNRFLPIWQVAGSHSLKLMTTSMQLLYMSSPLQPNRSNVVCTTFVYIKCVTTELLIT